jgi:WS/DGAT/MGAT family acyltransferase
MVRVPLSKVDTAWLRMDDPTNLMMITGIIVLGAPVDYDRLRATVERDLLRFRRFRQRIVRSWRPGGGYYWVDDQDFDIRYHVKRAILPPPIDKTTAKERPLQDSVLVQEGLQDLASLLASKQLDMRRPPWQLHLVEHYGEGCVVICRLHHSIADGMALVHVLLSLTESEPDTPWPLAEPRRETGRPGRQVSLRTTYAALGGMVCRLRDEGRVLLSQPSRVLDPVRLGAGSVTAFGRLLLRQPDPKTVFKGALGVPKRTAWSEPLALRDVKAVGKEMGGTVNDVLLAAMAGGLRRYLLGRGEGVDGVDFRAVVPVNLRRPGTEDELGNKFGLVFLALPIGIEDPAARLHELKRRMDALKGTLEPPVIYGILTFIGGVPQAIQDMVVSIFETKGTAVMTNVMGPKEPLYLAGAPLEALMFWVPQSGRLGLGVSILSYAGQAWLGVMTDEGLVPDPETIVSEFHTEFDDLLAMAHGEKEEAMTTIDEMLAVLDGALQTVDAMLDEQEGEEDAKPIPGRCAAVTKSGKPCKNRALEGSEFCRVHQVLED